MTVQAGLLDVSRETEERLRSLESLLRKWNPAINLVSKGSLDSAWTRHILDSAQIYRFGHKSGHWVDLGSGGGFPGLVVAILASGSDAPMRVTLIESDQRKATFLRQAASELSITVEVIVQRIETAPPQAADTISARALSALPMLLGFAHRHMKAEGVALFPKGATWQQEVESARKDWQFNIEAHPSATDPEGAILAVKAISHA